MFIVHGTSFIVLEKGGGVDAGQTDFCQFRKCTWKTL